MKKSDAYSDLYTDKQRTYTDDYGNVYAENMTGTLKSELEGVFANATDDAEALDKDL
jgi:hypothetical protein